MNRREFLKHTSRIALGASATPLIPRLISAPLLAQAAGSNSGYRAIVCVYLDGGNDGNNTVIPADSYYSQYATGRGPLALDRTSLAGLRATSGGRLFGLHPSLKNVASLYNQGHATWLCNAGPLTTPYKEGQTTGKIPLNLFSHTAQAAEWQSALTQADSSNGWAGRLADLLAKQNLSSSPVVISTSGWQLLGSGTTTELAAIGAGNGAVAVLNALQSLTPSLNQMDSTLGSNSLSNAISEMQSGHLSTTKLLLDAASTGSSIQTKFPNTDIGQQLQVIAQMINGRSRFDVNRQIFLSSVSGYDTHTLQLSLQASNLADLDGAVGAFAAAMQEINMFDQVTLFTMTDFARAHQVNSTGGTDHAWGNHHLIVGGAVKGGDMYGTFPSLVIGGDDDFATSGLWIPTTSGSQYAATLAQWLGAQSKDLSNIFPELSNFSKSTLGFLG